MAGEYAGQGPLPAVPALKRIARLQHDRTHRDISQHFYVEGVRNFVTALDNGCRVETLVYSERLLTSALARKLVRQSKRAGVPFVALSPEQFRQVSHTEHASGVGAVLRQEITGVADLAPGEKACWIVLENVRAPGNFGTLIRTASAAGATGFVLLGDRLDPYHPAVIRASMGAFFGQRLVRASPDEFRQWARQHDLFVVGASPDALVDFDRVTYLRPTALMLGEERAGLSATQRSLCRQLVRIPMVPGADSLNLGVAGSLLLYQILRE